MKKVVSVLLVFLLLFQVALAEESDAFYSEDYFTGDTAHVSSIMQRFANAGYTTYSLSRPTLASQWGTYIVTTKFFYVSTHGNSAGDKIVTSGSSSTGYTYFTSANVPSNSCKLVFLSACYSSTTNSSTNKNLAQTIYSKGASNVIGYNNSVGVTVSRYYEKRFYYYYVTMGYIIGQSLSKAAADTIAVYGSDNSVTGFVNAYGSLTTKI